MLIHISDSHRALGEPDAARTAWRETQAILDDLGHPGAHQARTGWPAGPPGESSPCQHRGHEQARPAVWNHDTHYYPLVLAAMPDGCRRALGVGLQGGHAARELTVRVPELVGIDEHGPSIALAREQGPEGRDQLAERFAVQEKPFAVQSGNRSLSRDDVRATLGLLPGPASQRVPGRSGLLRVAPKIRLTGVQQ